MRREFLGKRVKVIFLQVICRTKYWPAFSFKNAKKSLITRQEESSRGSLRFFLMKLVLLKMEFGWKER
ncbi:hypothetical protein DLM76_02420 [Leptospira yasudae]|nr:hypothetical protein DLM76_02420 [Leptospira yasudae]